MSVVENLRKALRWRLSRARTRCVLTLARLNRKRLKNTVFVGITGSAGKTTTKDLAVAVLGRIGSVSSNDASLNYLSEVGDVVLRTTSGDRFAVIEISTNKPGDIAPKAALVKPKIAALTVVQREHVKNFDSIEAIAEEKGELILTLPADGVAVLNIDDPLVRSIGERVRARRIWFGSSSEADIRLVEATSSWPETLTLSLEYQGLRFKCVTAMHGKHLAVPVLAAIGLGVAAGGRIEECIEAVATATTTPGRMQIVATTDGVTFIRDDYKAPYWSLPAALEYLHDARPKRKVAVIGTISDYSLSASKLYPKVARLAMGAADLVVFVGPHALRALKARQNDGDRSLVGFTNIEDANRFLNDQLREGDLVLLKGSNHADHLVRLMLARKQPVHCWASGCGLNRFCDVCPRLELAQDANTDSALSYSEVKVLNDDPKKIERSRLAGSSDEAWLIVGMGNFGDQFVDTPHNVGFSCVEFLAGELGGEWLSTDVGALCRTMLGGKEIVFFKPATPTNLCGTAIAQIVQEYSLAPDRIVLIHDDTDLRLGDVRLKKNGSDGGHRGVRSAFAALNCEGLMPRFRIGVRKDEVRGDPARSIVLERFDAEEKEVLRTAFGEAFKNTIVLINEAHNIDPAPSLGDA